MLYPCLSECVKAMVLHESCYAEDSQQHYCSHLDITWTGCPDILMATKKYVWRPIIACLTFIDLSIQENGAIFDDLNSGKGLLTVTYALQRKTERETFSGIMVEDADTLDILQAWTR